MARLDDVKSVIAKTTGTAVTRASDGIEAAESVARRAGLAKRNGEISKVKVARRVLLRPAGTARALLDATAAEIRSRKAGTGEDAG